jgi:hypothetical protein
LIFVTLLIAVPLGVLWFLQVDARTRIGYEPPIIPVLMIPLDIPLIILLFSSLVRAKSVVESRARVGFIGILIFALVVVIAMPLKLGIDRRTPDVEFLSTDAYFKIGGETVTLPFVAVRDVSNPGDDRNDALYGFRNTRDIFQRKMLELAGDQAMPKRAGSVEIIISAYQYYGELAASSSICPRLTREWSRRICRNERLGVLKELPQKFRLYGRESIGQLEGVWTVGSERQADQIADMRFQIGVPEIGCDRDTKFCTAAVTITQNLLAVWTVWSTEKLPETAAEMARRQGRAIFDFVQYGLGEVEDFASLQDGGFEQG